MRAWNLFTILFPTISKFPSSVKNLTAKPRTSRTVSALPFSPPTVLRRKSTWVFLPRVPRNLAPVKDETSLFVTSNSPHAPTALAWTTLQQVSGWMGCHKQLGSTYRSGMRSRLKCANVSSRRVSPSVVKLPPPKTGSVVLTEGSESGWPWDLIRKG